MEAKELNITNAQVSSWGLFPISKVWKGDYLLEMDESKWVTGVITLLIGLIT